ncbi:MAG: DNA recombination protein RmuC [Acholeplasmatales bacterium]|nr:DNA recombination protein RmuC [Acholeplasmatales bacterium]
MTLKEIVFLILLLLILLILSFILFKLKNNKESSLSKQDIKDVLENQTNLLKENNSSLKENINLSTKALIDDYKTRVDKDLAETLNKYREDVKETQKESNKEMLEQARKNAENLALYERKINETLNERIKGVMDSINAQLNALNSKVNTSVTDGFKNTNQAYQDLVKKLASIEQTSKNIIDLSSEVTGLKGVLENNQNRGKFGEFSLNRILFSVFGDAKENNYDTQYALKDNQELNERPDAVIFLPKPNNLLCIDSKFPFQDYKRLLEEHDETYKKEFAASVKKHITDVSRKYIINNVTAPYALLYLPSDAIFGFVNGELYDVVEYARSKYVVLTSPSTLQPILASINMIQINARREENFEEVMKQLNGLSKDFTKFIESWDKISKNIKQTTNAVEEFDKRVQLMDKKFDKINSASLIESTETKN